MAQSGAKKGIKKPSIEEIVHAKVCINLGVKIVVYYMTDLLILFWIIESYVLIFMFCAFKKVHGKCEVHVIAVTYLYVCKTSEIPYSQ